MQLFWNEAWVREALCLRSVLRDLFAEFMNGSLL
jgi:hypothetical protein